MRSIAFERDNLEGKKREVEEILAKKENTEDQLQKLSLRFNMLEVLISLSGQVARYFFPESIFNKVRGEKAGVRENVLQRVGRRQDEVETVQ